MIAAGAGAEQDQTRHSVAEDIGHGGAEAAQDGVGWGRGDHGGIMACKVAARI